LANFYLRNNKPSLAEAELRGVHKKLTNALSTAAPNSSSANAILWGLSQTYIALMTYLKNRPKQVGSQAPQVHNLFDATFKNALT
jgi:hypothetical protein